MKIGVIGWYGHQNYGDERILFCLRQYFSDHELLVFDGWGQARNEIDILNSCDYVMIGGGGLILRGCNRNIDIIDMLTVPFSCVGISIEADHDDLQGFLEAIKYKARRIIVRDDQSAQILMRHQNVTVAPDLTFLYPLNVSDYVSKEVCGLNLRPWYYWNASLHGAYHKTLEFFDSKIPFFKSLYPFNKWDPDQLLKYISSEFQTLVPLPFYFEDGQINDYSLMKSKFPQLPETTAQVHYDGLRYLVGMRFHSIVFSVQAGVPFISLSYQPKNVNFCRESGLEFWSLDIFKWEQGLVEKIERLQESHDEVREQLLDYRSQCVKNISGCMDEFGLSEYIVGSNK